VFSAARKVCAGKSLTIREKGEEKIRGKFNTKTAENKNIRIIEESETERGKINIFCACVAVCACAKTKTKIKAKRQKQQ